MERELNRSIYFPLELIKIRRRFPCLFIQPIYRVSRRAGYPCNLHRSASSSSITLSFAGDVAFPHGTSTATATSKGRADIKGALYKSITDDKASATVAAERRRRPRKLDYLECRCLVCYGRRENAWERKSKRAECTGWMVAEKATCAPHNPVMTSAKSLAAKEQLNSAVAVNPTLTLQIYSDQISNTLSFCWKYLMTLNFLVYSRRLTFFRTFSHIASETFSGLSLSPLLVHFEI